jgi:hypothetical protein
MTFFRNTVKLRGFLASDAEVPTTNDVRWDSFSVLTVCIATGVWKKQTGEWISRTERHRVICRGPFFCGLTRGMKRGDYVEIVGELRAFESASKVHALTVHRLDCPPVGVDEGDDG